MDAYDYIIIGAGSALGASSDAANMFKGALARGELRIIGATTLTEYKEYIGEDEALVGPAVAADRGRDLPTLPRFQAMNAR